MKMTVTGVRETQAHLTRASVQLPIGLRSEADHSAQYLKDRVPPYPPPVPFSRYSRTGTLGRSYYTEVRSVGKGYVGVLGNRAEHAPWVISSEMVGGLGPQAAVHAGRWYTLQEHLDSHHRVILGFFESTVRAAVA